MQLIHAHPFVHHHYHLCCSDVASLRFGRNSLGVLGASCAELSSRPAGGFTPLPPCATSPAPAALSRHLCCWRDLLTYQQPEHLGKHDWELRVAQICKGNVKPPKKAIRKSSRHGHTLGPSCLIAKKIFHSPLAPGRPLLCCSPCSRGAFSTDCPPWPSPLAPFHTVKILFAGFDGTGPYFLPWQVVFSIRISG